MAPSAPSPIAVQLYSLRHLEQPLDEVLGAVAEIGYTAVESIGDHGLSIDEMKALLNKHKLRIISAHMPIEALEEDLDSAIAFHRGVGNDTIVLPIPPRAGDWGSWSAQQWVDAGKRIHAMGRRCADQGIKLLYHNHYWEMKDFAGTLAIDLLFEQTTPESVGFEPDLAWIVHGGGDPIDILGRYQGRCSRIHAKDLAKEGESDNEMGLADVGHGRLDWNALIPAAKAAGGEWFIVEHDVPPVPLENVRRSFNFLNGRV